MPWAAVGAAVIKLHKGTMDKKPEWFWHLFAKCEAKAARIAEQAAHTPRSNGDATFIEVYARTLPELVKKALSAQRAGTALSEIRRVPPLADASRPASAHVRARRRGRHPNR